MSPAAEQNSEGTPLLSAQHPHDRRLSTLQTQDQEARSVISSAVTKDEAALAGSTVGERLPFNDYATVDFLHDLVQQPSEPALILY